MEKTSSTPFWLELRKEYIDDNFDKLLVYLQKTSGGHQDDFYNITIHLLRQRIEKLLSTISVQPLYEEEIDRQQELFDLKLLATYLLVDCHHPLGLTAYLAFMYKLSLLNPRQLTPIMKTLQQRLTHERIHRLGFTWTDLDKIGTDMFVLNLCTFTRFEVPLSKPLYFEKFGTACLNQNGLYFFHETLEQAQKILYKGSDSMDTGVGVKLRTNPNEKLKQSRRNNLAEMDEFLKSFIAAQEKVKPQEPIQKLLPYYEEQEVLVKITGLDYDGTIHVETIDPAYRKIAGVIRFEMPNILYYYTNTLHECFRVGDYLKATISSILNRTFNIEKQLVEFLVGAIEDEQALKSNPVFVSKLIVENPNYYVWITELGTPMYTPNTREYTRGDFVELEVIKMGTGQYYGKIDARIVGPASHTFEERAQRYECIRAFAEFEEAPNQTVHEEQPEKLSPVLLRILLRLFFHYQKSLLKPSERYLFLANAHVIAELVSDKTSASYIEFASTYLRVLVQFVSNEDIRHVQLHADKVYEKSVPALIRVSVLALLKEYGKKGCSEVLDRTVKDFEKTLPMLSNLARLIQTSNSMQDILSKSALNVIRREIIKTLSIETEYDADLEADTTSYLGVESGTQEFKTSMVYPPNNQMQPDEDAQNFNVMRGLCAFMNSTTGGTLYLGVNDQGYVTGIDQDLKYLNTSSIDTYMRYVQDVAKKEFGIDALPYLHVESLFDNAVVAVHVEPHPYRVVELRNMAYIRVNAESREMPEQVRLQLIARKVFKDKNRAAAISQLQHAFTKKKRVVLHNYASSHTGQVTDRKVEAYDILPDDNLVICYDCDKRDIRVFNVNRIGYIEIKEDENWQHTDQHRKVEVDVFHMSGNRPIHVSLQLDLLAKNLLVEEYPQAKDYLEPHKGDGNIWYFDTKVYQLEGVARFYIGLANHIRILDAPELQHYVQQFKKQYL